MEVSLKLTQESNVRCVKFVNLEWKVSGTSRWDATTSQFTEYIENGTHPLV